MVELLGQSRVGIMGGTFNPIHLGHLFLAEEARVVCDLEQVIFVPNNEPAQRQGKRAHADAETRFALTQCAIADNAHFSISRLEVDRPGPSYAFDTLSCLQDASGAGCELYFIVGADSLHEVLTWHRGAELFDLCTFVAAARPGVALEGVKSLFSARQLSRIQFLQVPGLHISSSDVRMRARSGLPVRYLVPDLVETMMRERRLYGIAGETTQGTPNESEGATK